MRLDLPTQIGPYEVRDRLGKGGMGVVYLAYDAALDRLVAVKVLRVLDEDIRHRFLKEARFAARVQHPHIVSIYAVGEHEGSPYIAMEYIAGQTLTEVIRGGIPVGLGRKVQWLWELASGLEYAHRHGIVHRDVKPSNLMIGKDSGLLRLLDFGIARDHESDATMSGVAIGTPQYMSPEQVTGQPVDARSDVFAFGAVAYELLSGRRAFDGAHAFEITRNVLETEPVPLTDLVSGLPGELVRLVEGCLVKSLDRRTPSLTPVLGHLRRIARALEGADDVTVVRSTRTPSQPPSPDRASRQARRQQQVASKVARAREALEAGSIEQALEAADEAAMLDEHDSAVHAVLRDIERAQQAQVVETQLAAAHRALEEGAPTDAEGILAALEGRLVSDAQRERWQRLVEASRQRQRASRCRREIEALLAAGHAAAAVFRFDAEPPEVQADPLLVQTRDAIAAARAAEAEREAHERAAREAQTREAARREQAERERLAREAAEREAAARAAREAEAQERAVREAEQRVQREAREREAREREVREREVREAQAREAARREQVERERLAREAAEREAAARAAREAEAQERAVREAEQRVQREAREREAREAARREQAERERLARDAAAVREALPRAAGADATAPGATAHGAHSARPEAPPAPSDAATRRALRLTATAALALPVVVVAGYLLWPRAVPPPSAPPITPDIPAATTSITPVPPVTNPVSPDPPSTVPTPPEPVSPTVDDVVPRAMQSAEGLRRAGQLEQAIAALVPQALATPAGAQLAAGVVADAERRTTAARRAADQRGAADAPLYAEARAHQQQAEAARRRAGQAAGAVRLFLEAAGEYERAMPPPPSTVPTVATNTPAPVTPTPVPPPPAPTTTIPEPASKPPTVPNPEPSILAQLDAFERAYESRSVAAVQAVWPGMPDSWRQSLQKSFRDYSSLEWQFTARVVTVNGDTASVLADAAVTAVSGGRRVPTNRRYEFVLRARNNVWTISDVRLR